MENRRKSPGPALSPGVGPWVPRGHPVIIAGLTSAASTVLALPIQDLGGFAGI